jgi:hypothetical protein
MGSDDRATLIIVGRWGSIAELLSRLRLNTTEAMHAGYSAEVKVDGNPPPALKRRLVVGSGGYPELEDVVDLDDGS